MPLNRRMSAMRMAPCVSMCSLPLIRRHSLRDADRFRAARHRDYVRLGRFPDKLSQSRRDGGAGRRVGSQR